MRTWADALLALSVMQAAASDIHERWQRMDVDAGAATLRLPNLPTLHQAVTKATPTHTASRRTGSRGGLTTPSESSMATDMAALKASGVVEATLLNPPPIVLYEEGATPPMVRGDSAL